MIEIYLTPIRQDIYLSDGSVIGGGDISHTEKPCLDCSAKSLLNNTKEQGEGALRGDLNGESADGLFIQRSAVAESDRSSADARPTHREDDSASRAYKRELTVRLLGLIFAKKFNTPPPVLAYSDNGKPYFVNSDLLVNVSHSGNLLAVAISDEGKGLGVDIQLAPTDCQRLAKLYNRYKRHFDTLPTLNPKFDEGVKLYFAELDSHNASFVTLDPTERVRNSLPCDGIRVFHPIPELKLPTDCQIGRASCRERVCCAV